MLQGWLLYKNTEGVLVLSGDLQVYARGCSPPVTRLLRYQHLRLRHDMEVEIPKHTGKLRPLRNRQPVVTDCGHEHPEDHLA